ncbi:MAG: DUF4388 domain-containing protein [Myxococcales bacterium]|nr:DUF4388 domain-containing protein [Myxococcales bacterium]
MSGPAKVIVVDADPAVSAALRFGLLRAGLAASAVATSTDFAQVAQGASLVLVGDDSGAGGGGAAVVGQVRQRLDAARLSTPILYIGDHATRRDVEQAGADEAVLGPVFLRDLAQVARIMLCERRAEGWGGTLAELAGVLGLARALSALGRSGVLTLTRGIRRGEIRYYHGEITSAQVGIIHGQAAFHQLLLWTEARFDFRQELVVRRQQIPLPPEEVMADAERFLESIRDIAGGLSPSVVLDVIPERIGALAIKIPTEVHGILNMFDGRRMLVDILEDSPYRVHETLRVVRKGFESKVLRVVPQARSRRAWREPLPIEDWLLGNDSPTPGLLGDDTDPDSGRRHKRDSGPLEWAALVPRTSNLDMPTLSPIVPASKVAGEIHVAGDDGRAEAAQVGRKVIVSEDAIMTPADRAEEARLVQERAMREAAEEAVTANVTREAAVAKAAQEAAEAAAAREAEAQKARSAAARGGSSGEGGAGCGGSCGGA